MSTEKRTRSPPDALSSGIILGTSFIVFALNGGVWYSSGLFIPEFLGTFQAGRLATTWIASLQTSLGLSSGLLTGNLVDRFGCRIVCMIGTSLIGTGFILSAFSCNIYMLYFTYAILPGIGLGMQFIPAVVIVQYSFEKKRGLATGLLFSCSSLGLFIFGILVRRLIDVFGWRGALLLIGGIALHGIPAAALWLPIGKKEQEPEVHCSRATIQSHVGKASEVIKTLAKEVRALLDVSVLKQPGCTKFMMVTFVMDLGRHAPLLFLPSKATLEGLSSVEIGMLVSVMGISDAVGRLLAGWLSSFHCLKNEMLYGWTMIFASISCIFAAFVKLYPLLLTHAVTYGFGMGCAIAIQAPAVVELLGVEVVAKSYGLMAAFSGLAAFVGPPFLALLTRLTHELNISFIVGGAFILMSGMGIVVSHYISRIRGKATPVPEDVTDNSQFDVEHAAHETIYSAKHLNWSSINVGSVISLRYISSHSLAVSEKPDAKEVI